MTSSPIPLLVVGGMEKMGMTIIEAMKPEYESEYPYHYHC